MKVKADTYEGKKSVLVVCKDCPNYQCFQPHNIARYERRKEEWVCIRNHNYGCPDVPILKDADTEKPS